MKQVIYMVTCLVSTLSRSQSMKVHKQGKRPAWCLAKRGGAEQQLVAKMVESSVRSNPRLRYRSTILLSKN